MSFPLRAAVVLLSLSTLAACNKVQARTPADSPALAVPAPDSRLVIPAPPVEAPVEVHPPPDSPAVSPPPARQNDKPVTKPPQPSTPPAPQATPPPPTDGIAPPQVLQTTAKVGELEKKARDLLAIADRDLNRLQRDSLSRDGQAQYDNAQQFIRQALGAISVKNYVFAVELADKAAILANQLVRG